MDEGLAASDLTTETVGGFLRARRAAGQRTGLTSRAVAPALRYLRAQGVVPPPTAAALSDPVDVLLDEYHRYLEAERGLPASSARQYLRAARLFLASLPGPAGSGLAALSAGQVVGYVLAWSARRQNARLDMVTLPALRSLLQFLHATGKVPLPLAEAVPAGRGQPSRLALPRAAAGDDLRPVLARCDRGTAVGRRDFAVVLTLARLALCGGEVARLRFADVGWRTGEITLLRFPYPSKIWLNGCEWAKLQVAKAGLGFTALANGFASCDDPAALQEICDRLGPAEIQASAERWRARLPLPLGAANYWWELSMSQVEVSRTIVFDAPRNGRAFCDELARENLGPGRPGEVELIFGRKVRADTPGTFSTRVVTRGVDEDARAALAEEICGSGSWLPTVTNR